MDRLQLLLAAVLSITCCVYAQPQHTVFAMVVGKGAKKLPEIKVNGVKMNLKTPQGNTEEPGALVQGPPSGTATFIVGSKASADNKLPVMAEALVMPAESKPKTAHEKALDVLQLTKEEKDKLFPCDDYQPHCKIYADPNHNQCRDVWAQKNCRKSCGLCKVPYGVFLGCQDLEVCKRFGESACMVRWVRETCKTKCGSCGYERQANGHITMGKKRHFSSANTKQVKKIEPKQLQKVLKKITKKATDEVKQAAAQVKQQKKDDKPALKPKVAVVEKPLIIKAKETQSDDVSDKNDDDEDDDDDDDDKSDDDDDASDQDVSGEGSSDDEEVNDDDDDDDTSSGEVKTEDKQDEPIRLDSDPRGEPVVAKLVNQPIKFNDAPGKAMHVELVKETKPKVEEKKIAKKVNNDKVEKKGKQVKKVQKNDKPKTKATKPKKLKN